MANQKTPSDRPCKDVPVVDLAGQESDDESRISTRAPTVATTVPRISVSRVAVPVPNPTPIAPPPRVKTEPGSSKAPGGPKKTIERVSLAEQQALTAVANRVEKHRQPKRHYCRYCRVFIYRGYIEAKNITTWEEHQSSRQHKINVQSTDGTWQKGCKICSVSNFDTKQSYQNHISGNAHKREFARRRRLEKFGKPEFLKNPEFKVHKN